MSEQLTSSAGTTPAGGAKAAPKRQPAQPARKPRPRNLPQFNVVLINDDDHSYDYVIEMLGRLFGHPRPKGFILAQEVDFTGRCIVMTTHRELAELKRDQIHAYGGDPRLAQCVGSMSARIEPAS